MTKDKKNEGITLIVLIITIIILLILSIITISILKNTNLFEQTKKASEKWKTSQDDEINNINEYENKIFTTRDDEITLTNAQYQSLLTEIDSLKSRLSIVENKKIKILTLDFNASQNNPISIKPNTWTNVITIPLANYGTGTAIINYSNTNGDNTAIKVLHTDIRTNHALAYDSSISDTASTWQRASCSASTKYDENTIVYLRAFTRQATSLIPIYTITLIPD